MAVPTIALNAADEGTTLRAMPGAVIYVRVSTKEQTENLSLPTQFRACEDYCRREGLDVLARFDNDVRSDRTRAGMKAALEIGRRVFLAPIGYVNAARSAGRSLLHDPERAERSQGVRGLRDGPLQQAAGARTRDGRRLAESTQPATQFAGHRYAAAQSALRRHHRRPRVRRAPRAWRLRGDHHRRPVPACPGRAVRPHPEQRAAAAGASGLPAPQLRTLRVVQSRAYRKLVEGPERRLRLRPLPARLPRRERDEGEAGDAVHRRTRSRKHPGPCSEHPAVETAGRVRSSPGRRRRFPQPFVPGNARWTAPRSVEPPQLPWLSATCGDLGRGGKGWWPRFVPDGTH